MADRESRLVLGSASPRRAALLAELGLDFDIRTVDIDEAILVPPGEVDPAAAASVIAEAKYAAIGGTSPGGALARRASPSVLLTADTLVACNGALLGKPEDEAQLEEMLRSMSGRVVTIGTAVCVGRLGETPKTCTVTTRVQLRELTAAERHAYVASGAGLDKAGGLALQAEAAPFMASVDGCWANVVGLPLCAVIELLGEDFARPAAACSPQRCGSPPVAAEPYQG